MTKLGVMEARAKFSQTVSRVQFGRERIVLERHGQGVAAVIPLEDLLLLEEIEDRIDIKEARKALKEVEKNGSIPWETVKKELGL